MTTTIYHNPNCTTSRNVLAALRDKGIEPEVVEYLKTGWTRPLLDSLLASTGLTARQLLRAKGAAFEPAGLSGASSDQEIVTAMLKEPVLVERPIVVTPKGAVLCRPKERLEEVL